jgi:hypothetical protein
LTINILKRVKKYSDFETEVLETLQDIENRLDLNQKAIAELKRDLPFYLYKALRDYYKRGFPL